MAPDSSLAAGEPAPVLILASRESGGSILSALLDAHPEFCGAPHLNVLAFEETWQLLRYAAAPRDIHLHGLLRFLSEVLTGEQSIQSVQAARRWLNVRGKKGAAEVHRELRRLVAPRRLVDYSPLCAQNGAAMARAVAALPDAVVVHVTRDPLAQGTAVSRPVWHAVATGFDYWEKASVARPAFDLCEVGEQLVDWSTSPLVFDPQFAWARTQQAARAVLAGLDPARAVHVRVEDLARDPLGALRALLARLRAERSEATMQAMLAGASGTYGRTGPYNAPFGVDFEVTERSPREALESPWPLTDRDGHALLPWRGDGDVLLDSTAALARDLGYGRPP